jgi:hypothetical protein
MMNYRVSTLLLFIIFYPFDLFAELKAQQKVSIMVKETRLMEKATHWAAPKRVLKYGDSLTVASEPQGAWIEVETDLKERGYIHESALTTRTVVLRTGVNLGTTEVESTNVVLAGKGFNSDVEDLYKSQAKNLDYTLVNTWESQSVDSQELIAFAELGGLNH